MATNEASVTLTATVQKIIPARLHQPEKAEIAVDGAEELYSEIRVENKLTDKCGEEVKLKEGAQVEVKVEAEADAVEKTEEK